MQIQNVVKQTSYRFDMNQIDPSLSGMADFVVEEGCMGGLTVYRLNILSFNDKDQPEWYNKIHGVYAEWHDLKILFFADTLGFSIKYIPCEGVALFWKTKRLFLE